MPIRKPHVAGTFYPAEAARLRQFCQEHLRTPTQEVQAKAVILPHAGYVYSGQTACMTLARVRVPDHNLLIGPNHRGVGADFAVDNSDRWETPLGPVEVDRPLCENLQERVREIVRDPRAHAAEHSLEVIVPMLKIKNERVQIAPFIIGSLDLALAREVAGDCAEVLASSAEPPLIVISNDMSHYEEDQATRKKDRYALDAIQNLDADGLVRAVRQHRITMCGFVPVYMLLVMSRRLGIQKATLVDYRTSADASGDRDRVVGYAGFLFE